MLYLTCQNFGFPTSIPRSTSSVRHRCSSTWSLLTVLWTPRRCSVLWKRRRPRRPSRRLQKCRSQWQRCGNWEATGLWWRDLVGERFGRWLFLFFLIELYYLEILNEFVIFSWFKIPIPFRFCFFLHFPQKKRGPQHISAGFFCPKEIPPWQGCPCGPGAGASGLGGVLGWRAQRRRVTWGGAALGHGGWCRITTRNARVRREGPRQLGKLGVKKKKKHHEAAENWIRSFLSRDLWKDVLSSCDFVLPGAPWCFSIDSLGARRTFYSDSVFSFGSCQFLVFCMPADRQTSTIGHLHPHQKMPTRWM